MDTKNKPLIFLENIKKSYFIEEKEFPIIQNVNLSISQGEFVTIIGPSGSGKSTLMNILGLLDKPTDGAFFLEWQDMSRVKDSVQSDIRGKKIGFVFQNYSLIPRLSVIDQVMLPLSYHGVEKSERKERAIKALERVGLGEHLYKQPEQLSGGQKQRVAIARAFVTRPRLILADEPTGALDTKTSEEVMKIFTELNNEWTTIIIITHSPEIAENAKRIVNIRDGIVTG